VTANISAALDPRCVVLELSGRKKRAVIEELVAALDRAGKIGDAKKLTSELLEREKLTSTALGQGIAVPHTLSSEAPSTTIAVGRAPAGIKYDAPDNKPVTLVFLMVGPPGAHSTHLRLLSRLARYLHDEDFRRALLEADSTDALTRLFEERETPS
jgi:fructose-specific phosphotransferase system IIA component